MKEAEEHIPPRRGHHGAVIIDRAAAAAPGGRVQTAVGLEKVAGGGRGPGHNHLVPRRRDAQERRAGRLHRNQTPKAAGHGIVAAAHGGAGVRLADGAGDGIGAVGARAAAAGDFIPANGVLLGQASRGEQQTNQEHFFHNGLISFRDYPLTTRN